jgi:hypothetical protein
MIDQREKFPHDCWPNAIAPPSEAIHNHRPESLGTPLSAVGLQIFTDIFEHAWSQD